MNDLSVKELRKKVIEKEFSNMNDKQFEAVTTASGAILILAGAGSGKTTVLVNRIAYLIKYGNAYNSSEEFDCTDIQRKEMEDYLLGKKESINGYYLSVNAVPAYKILAITFTNKAAGELKDRISLKLGDEGEGIWAGTFHSVCGKILRRFADRLGYSSHFTIYDDDDQKKLMKDIMKSFNVDEKALPVKAVLSEISSAKDKLITPEEYILYAGTDYRLKQTAKLYKEYNDRLKSADAMDFDDMIVNTVKLLEENEDILDYYGNKFRYVMVDEYQDTNHAQYKLVSLFAKKSGNICVVGDDDQSIYRFRGATIENILNFEDEYENAKVIRLEQNYRSTSNILDAANAVIKNNRSRKGKNLWTDKVGGDKITIFTASGSTEEAKYVAEKILDGVANGNSFSDYAVLYRMNAQSAAFENTFARAGISYRIIGGFRFFERKEVKDILSYLAVLNNKNDDLRLERIINVPRRGIGDTTVKNAKEIASVVGVSLYEVFSNAKDYPAISRASEKLTAFTLLMDELSNKADTLSVSELFNELLEKTEYIAYLQNEGEDAPDRIENVKELYNNISQYELDEDEPTLSGFLEEVALFSDIDSVDEEDSRKTLMMTIHSAKGLEFNNVFLVGMEEGIFPGNMSIFGGEKEIEEERRLAYVAITRAKKSLYITNAYMRMLYGQTNRNLPSRFLKEIPEELCEYSGFVENQSQRTEIPHSSYGGYSSHSFYESNKFTFQKSDNNKYSVGQTVEHKTFGVGKILKAENMGNDTLLEIEFNSVGVKRLMATFAKLKII